MPNHGNPLAHQHNGLDNGVWLVIVGLVAMAAFIIGFVLGVVVMAL
jgi:hypothetical protein